ncbi:AMP-binding protein [Draconibacterium sp. IB214405]|uniref:AMP-binding protein n=1 Tax=Draconibacterium sp. IB214405 TaxID=3097352 RepID=UPI002A142842|nr:AMP-binding protein [Draconibacterium sp. IB214405]MDX8340519.1 AMP-binding protein [Draconibacterium sp. IB214405]
MELFPSHITINGQSGNIKELLQQKPNSEWEQRWVEFLKEWYNPNDYIEVQTSGSTGTPKTITLKKDFVASSALRTIRFFNLQNGDRILHCLPSRYIAGKLMTVRALIGKLDLLLVEPASDFTSLPTDKPIKFAAMVINQVTKYLALPEQNIENLLIGGSAIPKPLEEQLQQISTRCYSSYAMTETATHIALRKLNGSDKTECYQCLDDISVELGERDCIRILMPGLENGFIQTNDLGKLKDSHHFKVLGRVDNVIISGGIKFLPEQIEEKLAKDMPLPYAIGSVPDEKLGAKIILIIEGKADENMKTSIETHCSNLLSKYEQPKDIRFIEKLPRTENGKINQKELKMILKN